MYILELREEALHEAYEYFDENIRALPKDEAGQIDGTAFGLADNDVDAFRHAYVSGVYTQEFRVAGAIFCGFMQEVFSLNGSSAGNSAAARNMDYWNNAVGRKYGQKTKSRGELATMLHEALNNREMIIDLDDPRQYEGEMSFSIDPEKPVIVLNESDTGRNELFADLVSGKVMTRESFVGQIQTGKYPGYTLASIDDVLIPMSKPDGRTDNNLG